MSYSTNKEKLLQALRHHTLIALKPSPIAGIGVFAIADIAKGQCQLFSDDQSEWIKIHKDEIETLPPHSRFLVENHCLYDAEHYYVPEYGFKMMDLVVYLNHSDSPNVISINEGEDWEALRDIKAGEELLIDYGTIVEE